MALPSLTQAVSEAEAGRRHPRNALEAISDPAVAERLIQELRDRGAQDLSSGLRVSGPEIFWLAGDAVLTVFARTGHPVSVNEAKAHIERHVDGYRTSNTSPDLSLLSVSDRNRGHHQVNNGLPLRADLHTLFDLGHVWVHDAGRIQLSKAMDGSELSRSAVRPW